MLVLRTFGRHEALKLLRCGGYRLSQQGAKTGFGLRGLQRGHEGFVELVDRSSGEGMAARKKRCTVASIPKGNTNRCAGRASTGLHRHTCVVCAPRCSSARGCAGAVGVPSILMRSMSFTAHGGRSATTLGASVALGLCSGS